MNIDINVSAGVLHIKVNGRFEFSVHKEFREAIKLAEKGVTQIDVNLENTDYLDSSALGMLLILCDKQAGKKPVQILNAQKNIKTVLEIANFNNLFNLH